MARKAPSSAICKLSALRRGLNITIFKKPGRSGLASTVAARALWRRALGHICPPIAASPRMRNPVRSLRFYAPSHALSLFLPPPVCA
jgi:hypothetical protein